MFAHRLTRTIALALALGAVAAPTALAMPADGPIVTSKHTLPNDVQSDLERGFTGSADTRDYEPMRQAEQPQPRQDLRNPDTVDFANGRGTYNSPEVVVVEAPQPAAQPTSGGIDWADAGLGAGGLLAISLIGLGGALFIVHRRSAGRVAV